MFWFGSGEEGEIWLLLVWRQRLGVALKVSNVPLSPIYSSQIQYIQCRILLHPQSVSALFPFQRMRDSLMTTGL